MLFLLTMIIWGRNHFLNLHRDITSIKIVNYHHNMQSNHQHSSLYLQRINWRPFLLEILKPHTYWNNNIFGLSIELYWETNIHFAHIKSVWEILFRSKFKMNEQGKKQNWHIQEQQQNILHDKHEQHFLNFFCCNLTPHVEKKPHYPLEK